MQAAIPIAGSLIGGYFQNKAAKDATKAQTNASNQAIDYSKYMFDTMRGDEQPFMQGGLQGLAALTGNKYEQSPGYAYLQKEGLDAVDASAANRGNMYSGGHSLDVMRHAEGIAAQDYNNWWNRQMGLAQLGQNAASQTGVAGLNTANNVGGYLQNAGNAQANGSYNQGNNWAHTIDQLGTGLSGLFGGKA